MTAQETIKEAAQTAPPVTVVSLQYCGVALQDWVLIATLAYTIFQLLRAVPKAWGCACCFRNSGWQCDRSCYKGE